MGTFQTDVLQARIRSLNVHQTSISTMSLWISHHHDECDKIAKIWAQEVCTYTKGGPDWLKAAFYCANDVIQNARKNKTPEIVKAFYQPFKHATEHVGRNKQKIPEATVSAIERVIKILGERNIYTAKQIDELMAAIKNTGKNKDAEARVLKKYENNIEERLKVRNKAFGEAIEAINSLANPPSEDSATRQKISKYPESIADPKNICPQSMDEAFSLLNRTEEAHTVVSGYAKSVKDEKLQKKELQKKLEFVDSLLTVESRLSKDLLLKSQNCMNLLLKKRDKLNLQKSQLPDEVMETGPLPDLEGDL